MLELKNITALSEKNLLAETFQLAQQERKISLAILYHLQEIDKRRAYAALGYLSLFDYMTKELLYAEASAMRRIQAMRAIIDQPQLAQQIETGKISVTQVARVQSFVRRDEKINNIKWSKQEKESLYNTATTSSRHELEQVLIKISPESAIKETIKPVTENLIELKIYLSSEEIADLNKIRGLVAHQLKNPGSNSELIKKMIQISKITVEKEKLGAKESSQKPATPQRSRESIVHDSSQPNNKNTRYIPIAIKRTLFDRAKLQCEHIDAKTKTRCPSQFKLEIDHELPYSLGGKTELKNLQVLCRNHNQNKTRFL